MELDLTKYPKVYNLSLDEVRIVELWRTVLIKQYADIGFVMHQGKLVSASVNEKLKFQAADQNNGGGNP